MKHFMMLCVTTGALSGLMGTSIANEVIVFPAQNQSNEQMEQDKYACYNWAKGQTGFDPMVLPTSSTPPPSQQRKSGGLIKGAAGGAVLGQIIGGDSKSTKRGAAAGALIGGVRQGSANRATEQKTEQWKQQEANEYANNRNQYNRAYAACLEGKGYTVK